MPLESLTPKYDEANHGTYLRRLEEAVKDPKNLNIALTGGYGAGKSSVLDEFEANHRRSTQRLAISTLAPGEAGETTTNRIQKEVVKQLLYGASQKVGKNSRFSKISVLSKRRAFTESAVLVLCVGGLLYLLGWLPDIKWTGADEDAWKRWAAWTGAAALATLVVGSVRLVTFGRFLSDVSAGGAGLTLSEKPESFFDKYLDEIVHYFERESKDIVVFEDLDRFEDPHIFEALRELNILLNETPKRRRKRRGNWAGRTLSWVLGHLSEEWPDKLAAKLSYPWATRLLGLGVPLRFVYAVRDSVFGKIDATTAATTVEPSLPLDAAAAETLRANRTKFFDIVIPLVPFISHRNARDLLIKLLAERGITGIDTRLVNTIAQHCSDMRLMRNMCNEYLVFAERLLEPKEPNKPAPGMDASHLFALVAYKNFHLEDFENITRRDSDLDRLYEFHQRIVRENIAVRDERKRELLAEPERSRVSTNTASMLGARLTAYAVKARSASPYGGRGYAFKVGSTEFEASTATGYAFWAAVAQSPTVDIILGAGNSTVIETLDKSMLQWFVPEGLDADRWGEYDADAVRTKLDGIERDIEELRRAGFADLAERPRFKLVPERAAAGASEPETRKTFSELLAATLKSELACDLVRRRYIDRNFSLYAAQFYGNFTGVDVANFMVQHVQSNTMAVDYDLSRDGAVANLLTEAEDAGEDLVRSLAAYNIDIVNHLLATDDPRADDVAGHLLATGPGQDARTFLAAYFTSDDSRRDKLAALMVKQRWRDVFSYLVGSDDVPASARPALVSAAMCAVDDPADFDLSDDIREFITNNYQRIPAFGPLDAESHVDAVATVLDHADVVVPELAKVRDHRLRRHVVNASGYELSAENLRTAIGISGPVSLDHVRSNGTVYAYCLDHLGTYVAAVSRDAETDHAIGSAEVLTKVLNDLVASGEDDQIANPTTGDVADLLASTAADARLTSLLTVPQSVWTALVTANLVRASLANVEEYRTYVGGAVDAHLASLLKRAGAVDVNEADDVTDSEGGEYDRVGAAVAILNAGEHLRPEVRVALAESIAAPLPLPVTDINWAPNNLFALLLERGMVADDETTFQLIRVGGWAALGPAVKVSANIGELINPQLVEGMVANLLTDPDIAAKVGRTVVENVDTYVPEDDWPALKAAAAYAHSHHVSLAPDTVVRFARVGHDYSDEDRRLLLRLLCATTPPASADHIVSVFSQLGTPYDKVSRPGEKFEVHYDETHDQLLKVLKADGRITQGTTRLGNRHYNVTVL